MAYTVETLAFIVRSGCPLLTLVAACVGACSPTSALQPKVAEVDARVHAAAAVGAAEVPQAALYLKLASDELEEARRLIDASEEDKAVLTLERATVDAELALLLHAEAAARERAHDAVRKVEHLSPMERGATP